MNWTREYDAILGEQQASNEYEELLDEIKGIRQDAQKHYKDTQNTIMVLAVLFVLWKAGLGGFIAGLSAIFLGAITALVK